LLVHHAGKSGDFRGSSKLAATFETIIKLERLKEETEHGEAQFRVVWDKVRAGGPKKRVREVVAKLTSEPNFEGATTQRWEFEAADLSRLDELKELLETGAFKTQKEIADQGGVSKTAARKWLDKGIRLGLWTERQLGQWFAKGAQQRRLGKTQAPVPAMQDWREETDEDQPQLDSDF
jgi:putative DNA primase/helicase